MEVEFLLCHRKRHLGDLQKRVRFGGKIYLGEIRTWFLDFQCPIITQQHLQKASQNELQKNPAFQKATLKKLTIRWIFCYCTWVTFFPLISTIKSPTGCNGGSKWTMIVCTQQRNWKSGLGHCGSVGWNVILYNKRWWVWFSVRAYTQILSLITCWVACRINWSMFPCHIHISLLFSLFLPLSKNQFLKDLKKEPWSQNDITDETWVLRTLKMPFPPNQLFQIHCSLTQWFSILICNELTGSLVKIKILIQKVRANAWGSAFLIRSQGMLVPLVWGPPSE